MPTDDTDLENNKDDLKEEIENLTKTHEKQVCIIQGEKSNPSCRALATERPTTPPPTTTVGCIRTAPTRLLSVAPRRRSPPRRSPRYAPRIPGRRAP